MKSLALLILACSIPAHAAEPGYRVAGLPLEVTHSVYEGECELTLTGEKHGAEDSSLRFTDYKHLGFSVPKNGSKSCDVKGLEQRHGDKPEFKGWKFAEASLKFRPTREFDEFTALCVERNARLIDDVLSSSRFRALKQLFGRGGKTPDGEWYRGHIALDIRTYTDDARDRWLETRPTKLATGGLTNKIVFPLVVTPQRCYGLKETEIEAELQPFEDRAEKAMAANIAWYERLPLFLHSLAGIQDRHGTKTNLGQRLLDDSTYAVYGKPEQDAPAAGSAQ